MKLSNEVKVRLSDEQKAKLEELAENHGLSLSTYIRWSVMFHAEEEAEHYASEDARIAKAKASVS